MTYYTTQEVAKILKLDVQTVRRKIQKGEINATLIGKGYRISEDEIKQMLGNRKSSEVPKKVLDLMKENGIDTNSKYKVLVEKESKKPMLVYGRYWKIFRTDADNWHFSELPTDENGRCYL